MRKNTKQKARPQTAASHTHPTQTPKRQRRARKVPVLLFFFAALWAWGALWYGDVFRIAREESFWAPDTTLMQYETCRPWGTLWHVGLCLLQLWRWPALGAALLAALLTAATWLTAYCLRLRGWLRLAAFLPAYIYIGIVAHQGFDLFFEAETGKIMGVPFLYTLAMAVLAAVIRSFSRNRQPQTETIPQNRARLAAALLCVGLGMAVTQWLRPYVRVATKMQCQMMEQDWAAMQQTARQHPTLSYRIIAAYYAIATVQRGEQGSRMFDLLMDYDEPYLHCYDRRVTNSLNYYQMDCDFHAGLVQPAQHHAMEHLTMHGPTLHALKMLAKCALMRGEWAAAEKYLHILRQVPFESRWVEKYAAMVRQPERVNADAEMKMVRLLEPMHDSFENLYVQPVFLGYNAALQEGRSLNALYNSLAVQLYTKATQPFIMRCQPLQGQLPPQTFAEALLMLSAKQPQVLQAFPGIEMNNTRLVRFFDEVKPMMQERQEHARELYPKYKGYYPYYYFFGNLKATKKEEGQGTSKQGVN